MVLIGSGTNREGIGYRLRKKGQIVGWKGLGLEATVEWIVRMGMALERCGR